MEQSKLVSILMPTYNHEKYISQAIESVLMQKTNFAWELLIHDDSSTDGTLRIAQRYAELHPQQIKLISETKNVGLMRSYKKLIDISSGAYLAILESDDVWLDENKLQIQADFLNAHDDYAIVATDIIHIDENGKTIKKHNGGKRNNHIRNTERWYEPLLGNNGIDGACSTMFKKSDFFEHCNIDEYIEHGFATFDHPTWLSLSFRKKCKYFPTVMAAYRIISTSLSNNADEEKNMGFNLLIVEIEAFIIGKYGLGSLSEKEYNHKICRSIIGKALKFRKRAVFCEYAKKLPPITFKEKLLHFVPTAYYWLFVLYHRKTRSRK